MKPADLLALREIARMIRPLLGEIGETIVREFERKHGKSEWLSRGIVGFAFQPEDAESSVYAFAETIRKEDRPPDNVAKYYYPPETPYIMALLNEGFCPYTLQPADLAENDIGPALARCQPHASSNGAVNLIVHRIARRVYLYAVFGSDAQDQDELRELSEAIKEHRDGALSYIKVLANDAIFLAEANARGRARDSQLFEILRELLEINFNEFDRYKEAQRNFVREIGAPMPWLTKQYEARDVEPPETVPWLVDIANAKEVRVVRALRESFRPDAATYLVDVEALDPPRGDQPAAANGDRYTAIAKTSSLESTIAELAGHFRLQQRFDVLGGVLPPAPVVWPTSRAGKDKPYVLVIPRVSGEPLSEFLRSRWEHKHAFDGDRVGTVSRFVDRLVAFADALAGGDEELSQGCGATPCLDHYGPKRKLDKDVLRKWEKTVSALRAAVGDERNPTLKYHAAVGDERNSTPKYWDEVFPNPLAWFERVTSDGFEPGKPIWFCPQATIHGDLHAGNVLVRLPEQVTVHDFDYVGEGYRFQDHATLEASLLVAVTRSALFREEKGWARTFVPLLAGLARQIIDDLPGEHILRDENAYDIWRVIQGVRSTPLRKGSLFTYRAILLREVLRVLASTVRSRVRPIGESRAPVMTGVLYAGLLLREMSEKASDETADVEPSSLTFEPPAGFFRDDKPTALARDVVKALRAGGGNLEAELDWLKQAAKGCANPENRFTLTRLIRRLGDDAMRRTAANELFGERQSGKSPTDKSDPKVIMQSTKGTYGGTLGGYVWAVVTDKGKPEADALQGDAALALKADGKIHFAVADGTGDSDRQDWVSRTALWSVSRKIRDGQDLPTAVTEASRELQPLNSDARQDNACCFAGVLIGAGLIVVAAGDSRFIDQDIVFPQLPKDNDAGERRVLGGIKDSSIITSGGNLVGQVEETAHVMTYQSAVLPSRFALLTDGAITPSSNPVRALREIRTILSQSKSAEEAARDIVDRALHIFEDGAGKVDNVTVLVAIRTDLLA